FSALGAFPARSTPLALDDDLGFFGQLRLGGVLGVTGFRDRLDRGGVVVDGLVRRLRLRLGHRDVPGRRGRLRLARTRSAVTISGASIVTSPAPMVTTTSPGSAAAATASATAEKSGRYR